MASFLCVPKNPINSIKRDSQRIKSNIPSSKICSRNTGSTTFKVDKLKLARCKAFLEL